MSASIIQRLILGLILVIFSFYLGASAVDGAKIPILLMGSITLLLMLNWLGKHAWILIFVAPILAPYLPLGSLSKIAPGYLVAVIVFAYYIILSMMGYVRLKWRSLWFADLLILLVFIAFLAQYIRYPIGVGGLVAINGQIGADAYICCLFATLFYVGISFMPVPREQLFKILKWLMFISLGLAIFRVGSSIGSGSASDSINEGKFSFLSGLGGSVFTLLLCYNSPWKICTSPWRFAVLITSFVCVLFTGQRSTAGLIGFNFITMCILYKQKILVVLFAVLGVSSIYLLSAYDYLIKMPVTFQRAVSFLPDLKVNEGMLAGAEHSLNWRYEMWDAALDPQRGYIKDYTWGDGYGISLDLFKANTIMMNRGRLMAGDNKIFMDYGVWHSGYIHLIHRMGYVGLILIGSVMIIFALFAMRVCILYRKHAYFPIVLYNGFALPSGVIVFFWSAGETDQFFLTYSSYAVLKLIYLFRMEESHDSKTLDETSHGKYVPMMLREEALASPRI